MPKGCIMASVLVNSEDSNQWLDLAYPSICAYFVPVDLLSSYHHTTCCYVFSYPVVIKLFPRSTQLSMKF